MKILIWFMCILALAGIEVFVGYAGYRLGAIPMCILFGIMWYVAAKLCAMWEKNHPTKEYNDEIDPYAEDK